MTGGEFGLCGRPACTSGAGRYTVRALAYCSRTVCELPVHGSCTACTAGYGPGGGGFAVVRIWRIDALGMSVKHGLLALLDEGPRYGYQLKADFEARTGAAWPLNVGQVYTTLQRLGRDGLVAPADGDDTEHVYHRITDAGRRELRTWFAEPVVRAGRARDELSIKLAMALTVPGVDAAAVIRTQREHTMRELQDHRRLKDLAGEDDTAWLLVLESLILHAEAEIRWLDHCEAVLLAPRAGACSARARGRPGTSRPARGRARA